MVTAKICASKELKRRCTQLFGWNIRRKLWWAGTWWCRIETIEYVFTAKWLSAASTCTRASFEIFHDETSRKVASSFRKAKMWFTWILIADPVSFAIHPLHLNAAVHKLLIVENKATFSLLPALKRVLYCTCIRQGNVNYGAIQALPNQLPLNYDNVNYYYFGDPMRKAFQFGIRSSKIWYWVGTAILQSVFTEKCRPGKEYQRKWASYWIIHQVFYTEEKHK